MTVLAKSVAATKGDLETLKWLDSIRNGKCHVWSVQMAAENGHVETFQWLLKKVYTDRVVADPQSAFKWVDQAIVRAVKRGHFEIV